ncbi:ABC transporter substrate-binding protein [Rhodococcus rhodochrous]|uniref:ABC transporter substrate-binding protein n=1 Tax=Rhodococcus rhodochrous TaxID=1829 RepID=UPI001E4F47F1|nr:ABC transporter substrate-binding protein [Rhodococcus rhodochrous]MCB8913385.1 ABC transporter substrate-binding protein [Rhodococcus rhodochrous]
MGIGTAIDCFDPQISPSGLTASVMRNVYDSLVYANPDGSFSPWLASSWEISPDATTYTFHLREGVMFHDGTAFDAAAVKANFDRIVDPATASQYAAQLIGPYRGTEVLDSHTVAVHLSAPYSPFLDAVAKANLGLRSPKSLVEHEDDLCQGGPVQIGTGPFTFASSAAGEGFTLNRNDAYTWAPGTEPSPPAKLASVQYRIIPESSVRLGALTSGEVDAIDQVASTDLDTLTTHDGIEVHRADPAGIPYTYFFNTTRAPFNDARARRAISKSIDLTALTQAIFQGQYESAAAPLTPATFTYDSTLEGTWGYDPDGARALLDELGYTGTDSAGYRTKDGQRLTIALIYDPTYQRPERITYDTAVQEALRSMGIELTITPIGDGSYIDVRNSGAYDIIAFSWSGSDPDLLRTIYGSDQQFTDGGANASQVRDPELDALLQRGLTVTDPQERTQAYSAAQKLILESGYGLPAFVAPVVTAHSSRVQGLIYTPDISVPALYSAWTPVA